MWTVVWTDDGDLLWETTTSEEAAREYIEWFLDEQNFKWVLINGEMKGFDT